MDRLPRRRHQHRVGVDAVHAILGAVILLGSWRWWAHCPSPERSPRTAGPAAPTTGVTRRETGTSPSSHFHAIRRERTHIHGHQDHIVSPREQRHEVDQENSDSRPDKSTPAAAKRATSSKRSTAPPFYRWRRSARARRSPAPRSGGTANRGRMGRAGLNRQGGDIEIFTRPERPARCPGKPHERFNTGDRGH
jgi:hypothetical protein